MQISSFALPAIFAGILKFSLLVLLFKSKSKSDSRNVLLVFFVAMVGLNCRSSDLS